MLKIKKSSISFDIIIILIFSGLIGLIYYGALDYEFINFDDPIYVTDNPSVKSGINFESISWAFGIHSEICMYWQPLAWISHMIDCELYGLDAGKHHLSSIIMHLLNTILLYILLCKMTGAKFRSAFAALIFAVHPVNVDPVIWIAERKTILSGFFWLSGFLSYYYYTKKPGIIRYLNLLFLFTAGILSKPVMVTFPFALLLFDCWPLNRMTFTSYVDSCRIGTRLILEKIPMFIGIGLWFITPFLSKTLMANETLPETVSYSLRISNAIVSYSKYVIKFIMPFNLSIHYPYPSSVPLIKTLMALFFLVAVTVLFIKNYKKRPYLIIGWLWFGGVLFPSSGILLGTLWPEMADRWAYLPYIGLCIICSWSLLSLKPVIKTDSKIIAVLLLTIVIYFSVTSRFQSRHWKDSITIFKHAESIVGYDSLFHQNMAAGFAVKEQLPEALNHQKVILANDPDNVEANYNTGLLYSKLSMNQKALGYLTNVIRIQPDYVNAYITIAHIYVATNQPFKAIDTYKKALSVTDKIPTDLFYNLSVTLNNLGRYEESELYLIKLLLKNKSHVNGNLLYGNILIEMKKYREALSYYQYAAKNDNTSAVAFNCIGIAYAYTDELDNAIRAFKKAVELDPLMEKARLNLQQALFKKHSNKTEQQ